MERIVKEKHKNIRGIKANVGVKLNSAIKVQGISARIEIKPNRNVQIQAKVGNVKKPLNEDVVKEFEEIDKKLRQLKRGKSELGDAILDIYDAMDREDLLDYEEAIDNLHYFDEQANIDSELFYLAKRRFLCLGIDI